MVSLKFHKTSVRCRKAQHPTGAKNPDPFVKSLGRRIKVLQDFAGKDKVENLVSEWKIFRRRPNGYRSTRTDVHADGISQTY
jgi:hypothetical protein